MIWLFSTAAIALYLTGLLGVFLYIAIRALASLRDTYTRQGYERGAREQLEDELERKRKLLAGRARLGR